MLPAGWVFGSQDPQYAAPSTRTRHRKEGWQQKEEAKRDLNAQAKRPEALRNSRVQVNLLIFELFETFRDVQCLNVLRS